MIIDSKQHNYHNSVIIVKPSCLQIQTHILPYWSYASQLPKNTSFDNLEYIDNQCVYFYCFVSSFTGKEKDYESGFHYYGARYYWSELLTGWLSVDPMADKYPSISPYAYCTLNPVKFVDPDGEKVKPYGEDALNAIKNTLPKDARKFVVLNSDGYIDKEQLALYTGESDNYTSLLALVSSDDYTIEVYTGDIFSYKDRHGNYHKGDEDSRMYYFPSDDPYATKDGIYSLSTGETGFLGKTLFPDLEGEQNSPNGNIVIYLNKNLSEKGMAETYSHEGNGHALLYIMTNGNRERSSHKFEGMDDVNLELKSKIVNSQKETINNML